MVNTEEAVQGTSAFIPQVTREKEKIFLENNN